MIHIQPESTAISFSTRDCPNLLELCNDGTIRVRGRAVDHDIEVVDAMRRFLNLPARAR